MSSIYVTEPPTLGKVLIVTNRGEIEIELWSKEAPKAVRNFVQLCLEGYYVDTIFHRIVPDFIIQGGDPTATGTGGESIFDAPFQDEFHSRLKYNRRGLLGMANNGKNDNGSQFFITLDSTPELQGKNTLFGRTMGDTIYNVIKMGQSELEAGTERPLYPPRITKTEVLVNPFSDIQPRTTREELEKRRAALQKPSQPAKKTAKARRTLLSFEDEEDQDQLAASFKSRKKGKSIHDLLPTAETKPETPLKRPTNPRKRKITPQPEDETPVDSNMLQNGQTPSKPASLSQSQSQSDTLEPGSVSETRVLEEEPPAPEPQADSVEAQIAALKASLKRKPQVRQEPVVNKPLSILEQQRRAYAKKALIGGKRSRTRQGEEDVMAALASFQSKLAASHSTGTNKPSAKKTAENLKQAPDVVCALHSVPNCMSCFDSLQASDNDDDDDEAWYTNALVFETDKLGKDTTFKQRAEQELELIDPREKAGQLALLAREERRQADAKSGRNQYLRRDNRGP